MTSQVESTSMNTLSTCLNGVTETHKIIENFRNDVITLFQQTNSRIDLNELKTFLKIQ